MLGFIYVIKDIKENSPFIKVGKALDPLNDYMTIIDIYLKIGSTTFT